MSQRGRVISQDKEFYRVVTEADGRECLARVSGAFRYRATSPSDFPTVGDYVMVEVGEGSGVAVIGELLPRTSAFLRKAAGTGQTEQMVAANIDTVFLCMALNNDFNLRRLERYLSIGWDSGAVPVVVLTKTDLCGDLEEKRLAVAEVAIGADVVETTALEDGGTDVLKPYLAPEKTGAVLGSSGVGKSTLINRLLGEERLATGGLRNDDKGHHTTTRRQLLTLPNGCTVIDTPGMRELGMWDAGEGIDRTFADIEALAEQCRFRDCTHGSEPGCAVRQAVEDGTLSPERLASYEKLKTENAYLEDAEGYLAAKEKKFKEISKFLKNNRRR